MLRIAICDDMADELQILLSLTNEFISTHHLDVDVKGFTHPDQLLTAIVIESFHLYILDVVMPMISGLELGKEIRRLDQEAQIIFVTTEPQFALQAYAANPANYLIKPIQKQQLFGTLTLVVSKADFAEEQTFAIKTAEGLRVIRLQDIICCEYRCHAVIFSLTNDEEILSRTFRENFSNYASTILKDRHFLQCHASFVINLRRVERFTKENFTLTGGKMIPIAAKQYPSVRDTYMDYLTRIGSW